MAENEESKEKKEKTGYVKCPVCGKVVKSMGKTGHFNFGHSDKDYQDYKDQFEIAPVPEEEEEKEKEEEEEKVKVGRGKEEEEAEESLYERPKKSHRVLRDICEEYGCRDRFIKFVIKRSKRQGGLTPEEFRYRLSKMKSGYKNDEEIRDIAEDYAYALEREQEKAEDLGRPVDYPIQYPRKGRKGRERAPSFTGKRSSRASDRRPSDRRDRSSSLSQKESMRKSYGGEPVSLEDVRDLLREERAREEKESKLDKAERKIEKLTELIKEQQNQIQQAQQMAQQPSVPENVVTQKDIEERDKDIYVEHLEEMRQQQQQRINEMMGELKEERKSRSEDREEMLKQLEEEREKAYEEMRKEASRSKAEGYKKDETRMAAEAMHRGADLLETRAKQGRPIEIAIKGLERLERPRERPEREKESGSREAGLTGIKPEFVED